MSVSTGDGTTCAVRKYKAYCWGQDIQYGYGNNSTVKSPKLINSSAMNNKLVTKVSVGKNHACLIANAKIYCWGSNSTGQLGDGTTTDRSSPTAVNMSGALKSSEIIDISAGDGFTCALATNSSVACWGSKADGRLGSASGTSGIEKTPKLIYTQGALAGKKVFRLGRASNATMCAIATTNSSNSPSTGDIYCWGFGISNNGSAPSGLNGSSTGCLASAPASYIKYFSSDRPVRIGGASVSYIDGQLGDVDSSGTPTSGYMSGLSSDSRARYWGRAGYSVTYSKGSACTTAPTPTPTPKPTPTPTPTPKPTPTPTPKTPTPQVSDKCTNAYWATSPSAGAVTFATPSGGGRGSGGGRAYIPNIYSNIRLASYNKTTGQNSTGGHDMKNSQGQDIGNNKKDDEQQTVFTVTLYHLCKTSSGSVQYVQCNTSWPVSLFSPTGGEKSSSLRTQTGTSGTGRGSTPVYSYSGLSSITCDPALKPTHVLTGILALPLNFILGKTAGTQSSASSMGNSNNTDVRLAANATQYKYTASVTPVGRTSATTPPSYPTTQTSIRLFAGTAYEGNNGGLICAVQSSSGTYCDGHGTSTSQGQLGNNSFAQQSGPKLVYDATKSQSITDISTAGNYTCAVIGGNLECWGANTSGQLGIGNTSNQSKPMRVTSWP